MHACMHVDMTPRSGRLRTRGDGAAHGACIYHMYLPCRTTNRSGARMPELRVRPRTTERLLGASRTIVDCADGRTIARTALCVALYDRGCGVLYHCATADSMYWDGGEVRACVCRCTAAV